MKKARTKTYFFLIWVALISGCANLKPIEGADETRILIVSRTSDQFEIIHNGDHFIPKFRPISRIPADPGWSLTEVFHEFVLGQKEQSKYTLVSALPDTIPRGSGVHYKTLMKQLADKYSAHYVLFLDGSGFRNNEGEVWMDAEYGYYHRVDTSILLQKEVDSTAYLNADINLFVVENLEAEPFSFASFGGSKNCEKGFQFRGPLVPISLPHELETPYDLRAHSAEELSVVYQGVRQYIEGVLLSALQECGVIIKPRPAS